MKDFFRITKGKIIAVFFLVLIGSVPLFGFLLGFASLPLYFLLHFLSIDRFLDFIGMDSPLYKIVWSLILIIYYFIIVSLISRLLLRKPAPYNPNKSIMHTNVHPKVIAIGMTLLNLFGVLYLNHSMTLATGDMAGAGEYLILIGFVPMIVIVQAVYLSDSKPFRRNLLYFLVVVILLVNMLIPYYFFPRAMELIWG